jgi:hypothetical protein
MYITNKLRNDGFGAQYQTIIFTILFAELEKIEFVYRPFTSIEHNYDSNPTFIKDKENLINIRDEFNSIDSIDIGDIKDFDLGFIYNKIENNLDYSLSLQSFKKIKNLFLKNKVRRFDEKYVAIHIRRPNSHDIGDYGYTQDEYFIKVIDLIRKQYPDIKKYKIYSQGDKENFKNFIGDDIEFHLNESIEKTFTDMVLSDILVMSKGSFSYCAGLLSDGIVYYLPFWHKPKSNWINTQLI